MVQGTTSAADIDLFSQAGSGTSSAPNVLLVIDNAANFSSNASPASAGTCTLGGSTNSLSGTVGGIEQCALYQVIDGLPENSVNIGIMVYNAGNIVDFQAVACHEIPSQPGGCLVYPIKPMSTANKAVLLAWIRSWKTILPDGEPVDGCIKANAQATGAIMQEAWAYFRAHGPLGLATTRASSHSPHVRRIS